MNKEEIKHFKAILRQGILRHKNILLDYKFQEELLNIIKGYEKLEHENKELHNKIDKAIEYIKNKQVIDLDYLDEILKDSDVDE